MSSKDFDRQYLESQRLRFSESVLELLEDRRIEILAQAEKDGEISEDTISAVRKLTNLMNTAADEDGSRVLFEYSMKLGDALKPDWPKDFPDPLLISIRFKEYTQAFEYALHRHSVKWEQKYLNLASLAMSSRQEDSILNQIAAKMAKKNKKNDD